MRHPSEGELALLACGELPWWARVRVGRHVSGCAACRTAAEAFRGDSRQIREELQELPAGLHWDRLAEEMKANVRVGLAAGACVDPVARKGARIEWPVWSLGASLASLCLLLALGWWVKMAPGDTESLARRVRTAWGTRWQAGQTINSDRGVVLAADTGGIEVKENGRTMTFVSPRSEAVTVSVSLQGSAQARYVDSETGQVTIANVYAQ
jgi:hypothetical protein